MQRLPHHYSVTATVAGDADHDIELTAPRLPILRTTSPAEFGGPGDRWSPETLLVGAVGDCLILTFRGLAHRLNLRWTSVDCEVTGTLDRLDGGLAFVAFRIDVRAPDSGGRRCRSCASRDRTRRADLPDHEFAQGHRSRDRTD